MDNVSVGKKLKELRKSRKISQQVIADEFHVTRGTVSNWEIGRRVPSIKVLEKLANYYGVGLDFFGKQSTKDEVVDLLARAAEIFKNEEISTEDKDLLYQDIMRLYISIKDQKEGK